MPTQTDVAPAGAEAFTGDIFIFFFLKVFVPISFYFSSVS